MSLVPLGERVLIQRVEKQERTKTGLFLPDSAQEKPREGVVLAVGADAHAVMQGERVVFGRFAGTTIEVDGEERIILDEPEIFGVIEA